MSGNEFVSELVALVVVVVCVCGGVSEYGIVGKEMTYVHIAGVDKVSLAVCLAFNWPQGNPVVVI